MNKMLKLDVSRQGFVQNGWSSLNLSILDYSHNASLLSHQHRSAELSLLTTLDHKLNAHWVRLKRLCLLGPGGASVRCLWNMTGTISCNITAESIIVCQGGQGLKYAKNIQKQLIYIYIYIQCLYVRVIALQGMDIYYVDSIDRTSSSTSWEYIPTPSHHIKTNEGNQVYRRHVEAPENHEALGA